MERKILLILIIVTICFLFLLIFPKLLSNSLQNSNETTCLSGLSLIDNSKNLQNVINKFCKYEKIEINNKDIKKLYKTIDYCTKLSRQKILSENPNEKELCILCKEITFEENVNVKKNIEKYINKNENKSNQIYKNINQNFLKNLNNEKIKDENLNGDYYLFSVILNKEKIDENFFSNLIPDFEDYTTFNYVKFNKKNEELMCNKIILLEKAK